MGVKILNTKKLKQDYLYNIIIFYTYTIITTMHFRNMNLHLSQNVLGDDKSEAKKDAFLWPYNDVGSRSSDKHVSVFTEVFFCLLFGMDISFKKNKPGHLG